jgi:hypothetical protein
MLVLFDAITNVPAELGDRYCKVCRTHIAVTGSIPLQGSSSTIKSGLCANAMYKAIRRRSPKLSVETDCDNMDGGIDNLYFEFFEFALFCFVEKWSECPPGCSVRLYDLCGLGL